jgi:hypothetical protein
MPLMVAAYWEIIPRLQQIQQTQTLLPLTPQILQGVTQQIIPTAQTKRTQIPAAIPRLQILQIAR